MGEFIGVKVHVFIGGTAIKTDIKNLEDGIHVVVGTPGRVQDMINKSHLRLSSLKVFVLDEADEMLSRGFLESMRKVISFIPPECRVCLFSATMPKEIVQLTTNFMSDPARILVKNEQLTLEGKFLLF